LILRKRRLAGAAFVAIYCAVLVQWGTAGKITWAFEAAAAIIFMVALVRFGLVTGIAALLVVRMSLLLPITSDFSAWYASSTVFGVGTLAALATAAGLLAMRVWPRARTAGAA
jgi:hypothetical protein